MLRDLSILALIRRFSMDVLIVGGGGREHALTWKLNQSDQVDQLYCAPGNAGIGQLAERLKIPSSNTRQLADAAESNNIDLTVVGPEAPLAAGIVDVFEERDLAIFGPNKEAAKAEASKVFTRELSREQGVPSPGYKVFENASDALSHLETRTFPTVVKADGLAAGKGAFVCDTYDEAEEAVNTIMVDRKFGEAGDQIVVEECLEGQEASILAICSGTDLVVLAPSQDHKQIYEGDEGPNTGGMGAYCPTPFVDEQVREQVIENMFLPTLHGLQKKGIEYKGVLYAGLMLTQNGPRLLEYNVRFGDPEAQPILQRMDVDLFPYLLEAANGTLDNVDPVEWKSKHSLCVIAASEGYPIDYDTGYKITGVDDVGPSDEAVVFHAGTDVRDGELVTDGGRVLGVSALGDTLESAQERAYDELEKIDFRGMTYRTDIGHHGLDYS